ncbi:hypothetical protein CBR_g26215 [Chara braunii]|uniref:Uncharacterized protein n=1 Tax=Chara braunii TaxID=69332 RepID=A0A388L7G5_CHABU|nr:hypothetical protein CBR_g26215 [Chara braunii]|eukprot:GBG78182.1 hypothetical protein CBR_g26215 [Chara braunii]
MSGRTGWNSWGHRKTNGENELLTLVREIAFDNREMREARRLENERRHREEQKRMLREADAKRAEEMAQKEAEKEARLAKMINDKIKEIDSKCEEDNKKIWEKLGKGKEAEKAEGDKAAANGENKKRGQDEITGTATVPPPTSRQRVNEVGALDAGLLLMNLDTV